MQFHLALDWHTSLTGIHQLSPSVNFMKRCVSHIKSGKKYWEYKSGSIIQQETTVKIKHEHTAATKLAKIIASG